jgi:hypothetical protein
MTNDECPMTNQFATANPSFGGRAEETKKTPNHRKLSGLSSRSGRALNAQRRTPNVQLEDGGRVLKAENWRPVVKRQPKSGSTPSRSDNPQRVNQIERLAPGSVKVCPPRRDDPEGVRG